MTLLTDVKLGKIITMIGIGKSKYYSWTERLGKPNNHNGPARKSHWLLTWEKEAIIKYAKKHYGEGYRRLTYMMMDEDVVAVSPATTYRILKKAGLLNKWNRVKTSSKGHGFIQPTDIHQHWHTDIKYVNFKGTYLFLITVIDGFSRYVVHHELRKNMQEYDVEITIQKALEKFPGYKPRIISDNGSQFISRDFAAYLKFAGLQHIRTSVAYPQSNGKIERFHRSISEESLRKSSFINLNDARKQISEYITYYNTKRLHSSLFYLTPEDVLLGKADVRISERQLKLDQARNNRIKANCVA
jgi:transposase InsO family protein